MNTREWSQSFPADSEDHLRYNEAHREAWNAADPYSTYEQRSAQAHEIAARATGRTQ